MGVERIFTGFFRVERVVEGWRKWNTEEFHNLYSAVNTC